MVFMMGPQFKLTGPSARGMSTELIIGSVTVPYSSLEHVLKPILHVIKLGAGNGIDVERSFREVFEDEDHVKLLQAELHTF